MRTNYDKLPQDIEILLIEDNHNDAELVMRTLKKNNVGNNLVHLTNGPEALDFLFARGRYSHRNADNKPKVILLDIQMPGMDGIQVLRHIREDIRTRDIPVVMMTASSEAKNIIDSYHLGVNSYVVKPLNFPDFAKAVSDLGYYWMLLNCLPK